MKYAKKFTLILYFIKLFILIVLSPATLSAQSDNNFSDSWSIGYQLSETENNFGIGIHAQSPMLFKTLSLKLRGNRNYFSLVDLTDQQEDWFPYYSASLSMVFPGKKHGIVQPYGESGFSVVIPPSSFENSKVGLKGFGLFGVRVFLNPSFAFFFEAGGTGGTGSGDFNGITYNIDSGFILSTGFTLTL